MTDNCIHAKHIDCKGCGCSCHWDKVLVKYFEALGRKQDNESILMRPSSYVDTRSEQHREAMNQVKLRLTDEEFDWIYARAPKKNGTPNIAAGVRNLIQEARQRATSST